jgi:hypothetical protein
VEKKKAEGQTQIGNTAMTPASTLLGFANQSPNPQSQIHSPWLFSARIDLTVFLGSALLSLLALWIGAEAGVLHDDTPDWAWVPAVLLIDVAHVHATWFRVYLAPGEFHRRPWLYSLVPLIAFALGIALYSEGARLFWRVLAYIAVFHFVRQQYGWIALYRRRLNEQDTLGQWIDTATIYAATVYPLIYWHTHLPRRFWWFLSNDFTALPVIIDTIARPLYWLLMCTYVAKSAYTWVVRNEGNPGKDIVVLTTAVCWYVGIVSFNSDYAFTVTNIIIHGVPYFALVYWYSRTHYQRDATPAFSVDLVRNPAWFLCSLWAVAYAEELLWDRSIWHERSWLFGQEWHTTAWAMFIVPLLALPQITHYILDGFLWKRKSSPTIGSFLS